MMLFVVLSASYIVKIIDFLFSVTVHVIFCATFWDDNMAQMQGKKSSWWNHEHAEHVCLTW